MNRKVFCASALGAQVLTDHVTVDVLIHIPAMRIAPVLLTVVRPIAGTASLAERLPNKGSGASKMSCDVWCRHGVVKGHFDNRWYVLGHDLGVLLARALPGAHLPAPFANVAWGKVG